MANRNNLIVGVAALFVAPAGADLPDLTGTAPGGATTGSARLFVDGAPVEVDGVAVTPATTWEEIGFTQEGIEVSYEPDFGEIEVDQFMGAAKMFKQNQMFMINTTLAEATLENLLVAWGQHDDSLNGGVLQIQAGALGEAPVERSLIFVGPGPVVAGVARERVYHVRYAIQTESTSHALRKNEATVFPVSFRVLPDEDGLFGTVRDHTPDTTATP